MRAIRNFLADESGPTSVEYAVMLALILMMCVATIKTLGAATDGLWGGNRDRLNEVGFDK
ncbi:MAG TPA: Flp family type IVb pilin [Planctomicrobium sp.]|nr:Flp family type IVb pilin [Planctomicrobium sp.]